MESSQLSMYLRKREKYACLKDISSLAKDMPLSAVWRHQMEAERNVTRLRNCLPDKLEAFCKMHLSILLDRSVTELEELFGKSSSKYKDPIKKKALTLFFKKKEVPPQMGNRFPTRDQVAQIYQLSEFLQRPENIRTVGLFRKTGNLARQRLLKELMNQGADLRLDDGLFSPHDCANVLKSCISELPEPLLTVKHFEVHCQIVDMGNNVTLAEDRHKVKDKQIKALQLLLLMMPRQNAVLLECLLDLLHKVSNVSENLMTAHSLGMVFAPSLICPKKLTSSQLHSLSELLNTAVSFIIESTPFLFKIPKDLAVDVGKFWEEMEEPHKNVLNEESVPRHTKVHLSIQKEKTISFDSKELMTTYVRTPEKIMGEVEIDSLAAQIANLMSYQPIKLTCEKEQGCIIKVRNQNSKQQKFTGVVSPIMESIKMAPKSIQMAMMTPRSRAPLILNLPMQYLETDL